MLPYFRFLSGFWQKEKGRIGLIFLFVMLSQSFSLAEPFFFTRILDDFLRQVNDAARFPSEAVFFNQISIIVVIWISTALAARTFKNLQMYLVETVADRIGVKIFEHSLAHVLALPLAFHAAQKPGEVFRKLQKAREDITALFSMFFDKIFQNSFSIAVVLIYIFWRNWHLGLALIGFVPIFFAVTYLFTRRIKRTQKEINLANEQLSGNSLGALDNIETVKAFVAESRELTQAQKDNLISHQNLKKKTVAFQTLGFAQGTIVNAARVALLWYGSLLAFRGAVTFGDVILFTFYSFAIYQPLYDLGMIYSKYHEGIAAVDRLQTLLAENPGHEAKPGGLKIGHLSGEVEFKNVNFSYDGRRKILSSLSFRLPAGKSLAMVGLSGGGKSSIVKLLLRFYLPNAGEILVDQKPVADYDLAVLRSRIGLVSQDTPLFNATLAENLRYGSFGASEKQVRDAAEKAYLSELLEKLPQSLATRVGERGVMLSGGEKQRVAIARAIIKKPDILVFDEATSSLDSHSEEQIKKAIAEVSKNISTITIAHRFSTVVSADEILFLHNGSIAESGTHEQLIAHRGEYARLYNLQTQSARAGAVS